MLLCVLRLVRGGLLNLQLGTRNTELEFIDPRIARMGTDTDFLPRNTRLRMSYAVAGTKDTKSGKEGVAREGTRI